MASTEAQLPIDESVKLPPSILQAAALAEAAHKAAYSGEQTPTESTAQPEASVETPPPPQPEVQPPPPQSVHPQQPPEPPVEMGSVEQEHHRYLSMKGRYEQATQTIGSMQEQMQQMGDELMRLQRMVTQQRQAPSPPPSPPKPLVTDKDLEAYGPELIDVVKRAALEAVSPELARLNQTTQQVRQSVVKQSQAGVYQQLGASIPNWTEINNSPRFKAWAGLRDVYSGEVRSKLLNAALQAADAPRVVAFFRGFLAEEQATGQAPEPQHEAATPRQAAVPLEMLAAPGRAKPAPGGTMPGSPADKPIFTRAQISEFYTRVRQGAYNGRDADKARDEAMIFSAQKEGRVRG